MRAAFCILALLALWSHPGHAQDDPLGSLLLESSARSGITDWKGFIEATSRRYLQDTDVGAVKDNQVLVWGEAEIDFRLNSDTTAYFRPRLYADVSDNGFAHAHVPEIFVTYAPPGSWDVRGGLLVENWGVADTFNPIDVLNTRDFATDVFDPLYVGQPGIRLRRSFKGGKHLGEPTVGFYWMPLFAQALYAPKGQRFHPAPPGGTFAEGGNDPNGTDQMFWALRYQSTLETPVFKSDIQLIASSGPDRRPPVREVGAGRFAPVNQGVKTTGFGIRAVPNEALLGHFLSTLTLKAEVAHRSFSPYRNTSFRESDNYWTSVIGLDRDVPNLFTNRDVLTLTLEYVWESGGDDLPAQQRIFQRDVIFRAFWQANDFARSTFEVRGVVDAEDAESIIEASFSRQLDSVSQDVRLQLRYQRFDHGSPTLLSRLPNNSSVSIGFRWDF